MVGVQMSQVPCKRDCPNRAIGCHGRCEAYGSFRAEQEARYRQNEINASASYVYVNVLQAQRKKLMDKKARAADVHHHTSSPHERKICKCSIPHLSQKCKP